eukprot:TRINITY_DN17438_c0_g1_i1.p1 TRINITY_DN17438_c0_g1~~TRINITY_DN17438_c0_g1_i1.p1  ORF type:complete len:305 (+),score=34.41 TRINITY_DN17438_c0_g1_i1:203-1117(+)
MSSCFASTRLQLFLGRTEKLSCWRTRSIVCLRSISCKPRKQAANASNTLSFPLFRSLSFKRTTISLTDIQKASCTGRAFGNGGGSSENSPSSFENREILVQHILVPHDKSELLASLQQRILREGVDLSDLATEYSICPSKEEGGMLGWVQKGQMVPEFEDVAFSSPLNKLVRCKSKFGWHLLQVLAEREGRILEDIKIEDFHSMMTNDNYIKEAQLIDVREPEEVAIASIRGFTNFPLKQFGTWGPTVMDKLDPSKDTYVLCHHGVRSSQVAKWLQTQGFKRVYNISGGIHQYSLKIDSSIPTY